MQTHNLLLHPGTAEVIRAHQSEVWRYLRYLGAKAELAEDLCQETFLVWLDDGKQGIRDMSHMHLRAWLRGVARNLYLANLRKSHKLAALDLESEAGIEAAEQVWLRQAGEDGGEIYLSALEHCMKQLEERERWALEHRHGENASRESIGDSLGLSDSGVKSLLRRARARLKFCIRNKVGA